MTTGINLLDIAIPIILLLYFLAGVRSGFFHHSEPSSAWVWASAPQPARTPRSGIRGIPVEPHDRRQCSSSA